MQFNLTWNIKSNPPGGTPYTGTPYTVPAGQTLVLEYTTGFCDALNAGVLGLTIAPPQIKLSPIVTTAALLSIPNVAGESTPVFNVSSNVSVPAGTVLNLFSWGAGRASDIEYSLVCWVTVNGHLFNNTTQ